MFSSHWCDTRIIIVNCGAELVPVIYNTRKKGITEVISPARRAVNELGCLKECLIAGTKS